MINIDKSNPFTKEDAMTHVWVMLDSENKFLDLFSNVDLVKKSVYLTHSRDEQPTIDVNTRDLIKWSNGITAILLSVKEYADHL